MVAVNDDAVRIIRKTKALHPLFVVRFGILLVLGVCYFWAGTKLYSSLKNVSSLLRRENEALSESSSIPKADDSIDFPTEGVSRYSTETVTKTIQTLALAPNRLLIYDPPTDSFLTYTVAVEDDGMMKNGGRCNRCRLILPMLVDALRNCCGERFNRHQPPFQMLLSDADFTYSKCTLPGQSCDKTDLAPVIHWGSVLKDASVLTFIQTFPNPDFLACMREWYLDKKSGSCRVWVPPFGHNVSWSDLTPQVIWRGSAFNFLETLDTPYFNARNETSVPGPNFHPRGSAVQMSEASKKQDSTPWIDVANARGKRMRPSEMAAYRYQIDIGGAGGTSWTGTLEKLAMPGLLLHHETPAMDWFYPEIVAWKHYVPIRTDLTDLKEKYAWAERNSQRAQEIAESGTVFARSFFSSRNAEEQYKRFFGRANLIRRVNAYNTSAGESLHSILDAYGSSNVAYKQVSSCTRQTCFVQALRGAWSFALNSSECFRVSNISTPVRVGPVETCYK